MAGRVPGIVSAQLGVQFVGRNKKVKERSSSI
jgi:hypothetical protein